MKRNNLNDLMKSIGRETLKRIDNINEVMYKVSQFEDVRYFKQNKAIYSGDILLYKLPAYATGGQQ